MYRLIILFFIAFVVISQSTESKVRIIHSDLNLGRKIENEQIRILKGSVHLQRDTVNMWCDSAYYYEERNTLELIGSVILRNGQRTINAHRIFYYPDDKLTECLGRVRVSSPEDSLYANRLIYNTQTNEASAYDSVYIYDKKGRNTITGDKGYFDDRIDFFRATGNARFVQVDSSTGDTLKIVANILEYHGDSSKFAFAVDSVKILQGSLVTNSDTTWYYSDTETAWLRGNPVVWFENNELTGDEIKAVFDSTDLKKLNIYGNAQAKTVNDSTTGEYNLLKGKSIEFVINKKKPELIIARNNARSIYFIERKEQGGSNFSTSDSIYVFFNGGVLDSIEIIGGAQGIYYPDQYKGERSFGE